MTSLRFAHLLVATAMVTGATAATLSAGQRPAAAASDPTLAWSVDPFGVDWNRSSSPTLADIDGDGIDEIVVGHQDGILRVFEADGSLLWSAPTVAHRATAGVAIDSTPAVADLDADGTPEIIVGVGSTWIAFQHGGLVVMSHTGEREWAWTGSRDYGSTTNNSPVNDGFLEGVYSSPSIGDVDGDGRLDIVFGGWDQRIHAIDNTGANLAGFPFANDDTVWSSPALIDSDGDGRDEIFIGGDSTAGGDFDNDGGVFRALDWTPDGVRELWNRAPKEVLDSSPAIGDINGDGRLEVVIGAGDYYHQQDGGGRSDSFSIFAWHLDDGSVVPGWPRVTGGITLPSPALGDLDGDGVADVVAASHDETVWAWRGDGSLLWRTRPALPPLAGPDFGNRMLGSPVIADLDGDGDQDVAAGSTWALHLLDGQTGAEVFNDMVRLYSVATSPAVGDFGPAGRMLIVSGFRTEPRKTRLEAWRLPASGATDAWPMFRREPTHDATLLPTSCGPDQTPTRTPSASAATGLWALTSDGRVLTRGDAPHLGDLTTKGVTTPAIALSADPDGSGYWIIDEAGVVHAFGDAGHFGDMTGVVLNGPVIGMTPTPSANGYWLLGRDGGVFSFGDAAFWGSMGGTTLNGPVIGMSATVTGNGYWLLASDGGIFAFGDAAFWGSTGGMALNAPVLSMAVRPDGAGYWLIARDGGVFGFNVAFRGSLPGLGLCETPVGVQVRPTSTGSGYYVLTADGRVFPFGDAPTMSSFDLAVASMVDLAVRTA